MPKRTDMRCQDQAPSPYATPDELMTCGGSMVRTSVLDALRALPPVVYYVRIQPDLIKIGHTGNLEERLRHLGAQRSDLLIVLPGDLALEREHHKRWSAHLVRGREWFRECEEILSYVNTVRDSYGVPDAA